MDRIPFPKAIIARFKEEFAKVFGIQDTNIRLIFS